MGGRGTYAAGKANTPFTYKTVGYFHGIKVLEGIDGKHNLPEESHSSEAYVKLYKDGNLQKLRFYDENHYLVLEIDCHREPSLTGHYENVYHIHEYTREFKRTPARLLTDEEIKQYSIYFTLKGHLR